MAFPCDRIEVAKFKVSQIKRQFNVFSIMFVVQCIMDDVVKIRRFWIGWEGLGGKFLEKPTISNLYLRNYVYFCPKIGKKL